MSGNYIIIFLVTFPFASGLIIYLTGRMNKKNIQNTAMLLVIAEFTVALVAVNKLSHNGILISQMQGFSGLGAGFVMDGFRAVFVMITAFTWLVATMFLKGFLINSKKSIRFYIFFMMTLGATMGVFLSSDLFTTFVFFEIMGLTSYINVIHYETKIALRAGTTYLAVAVIGGMIMLMGLLMLNNLTGTMIISELANASAEVANKTQLYIAGTLILIGFGAKAGMFPLHFWLPGSYTSAPVPVTAVLSAVLSKTGVFGIIILATSVFKNHTSWGYELLVIAILTIFVASIAALFATDARLTLAYSSMSQIGFIIMGVALQNITGHENVVAARGAFLHAVNHSLIKLVLFIVFGVVLKNIRSTHLNDIRGFAKGKPLFSFCFIMGLLAITGMPLWNGYISKTLLHEGIAELSGISVYLNHVFTLASALTVAYMTKLFVALFLDNGGINSSARRYMSKYQAFALGLSALLLPLLGSFPGVLLDRIAILGQNFMQPDALQNATRYFSFENIKGILFPIVIGVVIYVLLVRKLIVEEDTQGMSKYKESFWSGFGIEDIVYRPLISTFLWTGNMISIFLGGVVDAVINVLSFILRPLPTKRYREKEDSISDNIAAITFTRSLSFGLLLFGIGSCLILLYLLYAALK